MLIIEGLFHRPVRELDIKNQSTKVNDTVPVLVELTVLYYFIKFAKSTESRDICT